MPTQKCVSVSHLNSRDVKTQTRDTSKKEKSLRTSISQPNLHQYTEEKCPQELKKKVRKKKKFVLSANLTLTKYNLVQKVCADYGFNITDHSGSESMLIWSDSAVPMERITDMKPYQKINHFAGMGEICRKDSLARNMWKVSKLSPEEFNFVPQTWVLPGEYAMFQFHARENRKKRPKTYIRKPVNGAMGHGIWLTRNVDRILANDACIVQEYLDKPLLMDGYKFDLRMYVLVLSCDPLKVYLYKDGLVRMGTTPYSSPSEINVSNSFMHLTNYSINKHSENFMQTSRTEMGSKRTLKYFWAWLQERSNNAETIWNKIVDVIIKTILVAMPHLFHAYHMCRGGDPANSSCCFEILGFDIFIDRKYKPWVLEVNRAPSFSTDQELDYEIKFGVLSTTLNLLNIRTSDRRKILKAEKMESQRRLVGNTLHHKRPSTSSEQRNGNNKDTNGSARKRLLQKRKKDLKWRLNQIRDLEKRSEYEAKHSGEFVCIYPPSSTAMLEHYKALLSHCTKAVTGRTSLRREHSPLLNLKEEEILDLLQEVEADVLHLVDDKGQLILKPPAPLSSMPQSTKKRTPPATTIQQPAKPTTPKSSTTTRSDSIRTSSRLSIRSPSVDKRQSTKTSSEMNPRLSNCTLTLNSNSSAVGDDERERKTEETLKALLEMNIKFPGKTDEEARKILDQIQDNWKLHRPHIAAYWLVKLDAGKRRKVIDIVRGNVNAILQRVWKTSDIESLTLHRMFTKLFNRLLWNHGQGLWNCFSSTSDSWEAMFMRSSEKFIQSELQCCREVVKLCRECLLVVYQFASESDITIKSKSSQPGVERSSTSNCQTGNHQKNYIRSQTSTGHLLGTKKLYK